MKMSFPIKLLKNRDESDETQSDYYDHEAIGFRGQKYIVLNDFFGQLVTFRLWFNVRKLELSSKHRKVGQNSGLGTKLSDKFCTGCLRNFRMVLHVIFGLIHQKSRSALDPDQEFRLWTNE